MLLGDGEIRRALRLLGARQPLHRDRDRGPAHARAAFPLGVPRGAQGARPRQRLRLAGLPRVPRARAEALGRVRGGARAQRALARRASTRRPSTHPDMYDLAEALIELDERTSIWRDVHVKMVQRVIGGGAIGTQGTPVAVLAGLTKSRLFPALWDVRNTLTEIADSDIALPIDAPASRSRYLIKFRREGSDSGVQRVCIIGAGAIGSLFAGHLASVADVSILTRAGRARRGARARRAAHQRAQRPPGHGARLGRSRRAAAVRPRHRRDEGRRARGGRRVPARPLPGRDDHDRPERPRRRGGRARAGDWPIISGVTFMSGTRHSDTHVEYVLDTETWIGPYEVDAVQHGAGGRRADDERGPQGRGAARPAARAVVEADLQRHRQRRRGADRAPPRPALRRRGAAHRPRASRARPRRRGQGGRRRGRHRAARRPLGDERPRHAARARRTIPRCSRTSKLTGPPRSI